MYLKYKQLLSGIFEVYNTMWQAGSFLLNIVLCIVSTSAAIMIFALYDYLWLIWQKIKSCVLLIGANVLFIP
jgi:hypothetical protein